MPNALSRTAGLRLGPVALETLLRHYFEGVKREKEKEDDLPHTRLRQDELLYDEAFNIAKRFFEVSTHHPVEELQEFSNTRILSPPWVHVARVTVPISCCDEAATLLIRALGGEEHASLLVGGTKWWQVRGVTGIAGEWVTAKKDWEEAKKRRKAFEKPKSSSDSSQEFTEVPSVPETSQVYDKDADDMRCILYTHGGGYYFGSVDQERYCIQRLARKIRGRVFAINYRLAPQYPFPCALQDLLAAYLYLIQPPPDAPHRPVDPAHIVVAGSSAGGGLTFALLQLLRDTGQPMPAGSVLISPWCDLTHSFPSTHVNTATDILPTYGLSLHKPSALWPPPSEEMTRKVHTGLRRKIQQIVRITVNGNKTSEATTVSLSQETLTRLSVNGEDGRSLSCDTPIDGGGTASLPSIDENGNQTVFLETKTGEQLKIDSQIQLYTQNSLIAHPLVSPALSYLGGLPPLFIIAGDKEVLRDEIIYSAHKAANPSKFPLKDEHRALYPPLVGIEERYGPTQVHLQVYDDVAHCLPVVFPFTTPGKYSHRAIAAFTKLVTGMLPQTNPIPTLSEVNAPASHQLVSSPLGENEPPNTPIQRVSTPLLIDPIEESQTTQNDLHNSPDRPKLTPNTSNRRSSSSRSVFFSFQMKSPRILMTRSTSVGRERNLLHSKHGLSVGGRGKLQRSVSMIDTTGIRYAGEASVYYNDEGLFSWSEGMIRERVSTQGMIRSLEPAEKLDALHVPLTAIGTPSERIFRRYLEGKALFDQKYAKEILAIERKRRRNLDLAKKDITKNLTHLEELRNGREPGKQKETGQAFRDGHELSSGAWGWAYADERPPPSSIVSRRDTDESRRLARIADQLILQDEAQMNSNNLWTIFMNTLATSSPKDRATSDPETADPPAEPVVTRKSRSMFTSFRIREKQPKEHR